MRIVLFGLLILFILMPVFSLALWAFASRWPWPDLLPAFTLKGLTDLFASPRGGLGALLLGTGISLCVAGIAVVVLLPVSRVLAFYDFKGKGLIEGLLIVPLFVPAISIALGAQLFLLRTGLANTVGAVVLVQVVPCFPYVAYLLRNGFEAFGQRYEERAQALGASWTRVWWDITLPLMRPYIAAAVWMAFLVSSGQYLLTFYVGGGWVDTPTTQLFAYAQNGERRDAAVLSLLFLVFCMGLSWLFARIGREREETFDNPDETGER